jgi:hypothetical protein
MFLWVGGSQTAAAYSIVGRTKVVNARSLADWRQVPMFLLTKGVICFFSDGIYVGVPREVFRDAKA